MKYLLAVIFAAITVSSYSQSFEGTLTYIVDLDVLPEFIEKTGIDKETLLNKMKEEDEWSDTIRITYKGGNYHMSLNNGKSCAIYLSSSNKLYLITLSGEDSDVCVVADASVDKEYAMFGEMPKIEKLDTQVVVNEINCSIVRVKWKAGVQDYYYNSEMFSVNPSLFKKHIHDGLSQFLEISKALPIQIVKEVNGMTRSTMTLIYSESKSVDDSLFTIPKLVKDKKTYMKLYNTEIMRVKKAKSKK